MTIPMMPGWWDSNKEALESLAQTATRMVNPQFDNQLALMQNIRQNPANLQTVIDTAYLNPQMFAQTYGERGLQQISQMGQPSSAGRIEKTSREIFDKPIAEIPSTVGARAAQEKLGVPSAARLRTEEAQATTLETNLAESLRNITRSRNLQAITDPIELKKAQEVLAALEANPVLGSIDIAGLIDKQMSGTMTDRDRQAFLALASNPEYEKYYYSTLGIASAREAAAVADRRQDARLAAQLRLTKEQIDRAALDDARTLIQRANTAGFPITMADAVKYLTPGKEEEMSEPGKLAIQRLANFDQTAGRLKAFQGFLDDFTAAARNPNADTRKQLMTGQAANLSSLMGGAPIEIMSADPDGNWFSKDTAFRLYGKPLTGADVQGLIRDPNQVPVFEQRALAEDTDSPIVVNQKIAEITADLQNGESAGVFAENPAIKAQLQAMLAVWQNRLSQLIAAENRPRRGR